MRHQIAAACAAIVLVAGCKEKSAEDLAKDAQHASGEVVDERKDVSAARERLDKARDDYEKQTRQLESARKHEDDARSDLARRAREDSAAIRKAAGSATTPAAAAPAP